MGVFFNKIYYPPLDTGICCQISVNQVEAVELTTITGGKSQRCPHPLLIMKMSPVLTPRYCQGLYHFAPLDMKRCICHFKKWQIHPFIFKGATYFLFTLSWHSLWWFSPWDVDYNWNHMSLGEWFSWFLSQFSTNFIKLFLVYRRDYLKMSLNYLKMLLNYSLQVSLKHVVKCRPSMNTLTSSQGHITRYMLKLMVYFLNYLVKCQVVAAWLDNS